MDPQNRIINQVHQHLFSIIYLFFRSTMDTVSQQFYSTPGIKHQYPYRTRRKHMRYENAVAAAGDVFVAPAFTPTGCPFPSALSFFRELAHTGDSVPLYAGREQ